MTTLSQLLPDTTILFAQRGDAQRGAASLIDAFDALRRGGETSPLGSVVNAVVEVQGQLDIDVSGLTSKLPAAIQTVQHALPTGSLEFVESIDQYYRQAHDLLIDSPLAQSVGSGDLTQVALGMIEDALTLFRARLNELAQNLFGPDQLAEIADVLTAFEQFRSDFPAHQEDFLPFLSRYLIGLGPDLLQSPLDSLATIDTLLGPAALPSFDAAIDAASSAVNNAYAELIVAISDLDPAEEAGYTRIMAALDALDTATNGLIDGLMPTYHAAQVAVESDVWQPALEAYQAALEAVPLERIPSIDDVVETIDAVLGDILTRLLMTFGPDDVRERMESLIRTVRDTFLTSPLGQVRRTMTGLLTNIRNAIARIPTEIIQQTIEQMLGRVKAELEGLGIDQIGDQIAAAFEQARSFIIENLNTQVIDRAKEALRTLAEQARNVPITDLMANLNGAITQIQGAIGQIEQAVADQIQGLKDLLAQLDTLSYEPISNEVIGEINAVKARLQAINSNALSEPEKLALRGALAVLDAIDLKAQISGQLKPAYHSAEEQVKHVLDDITAALHQFIDQIAVFKPDALLKPIQELLGQVTGALNNLSGSTVITPLTRLVDEAIAQLEAISPAQLLDPLQEPYEAMLRVVEQINPERWLAPLNTIYDEIDKLIAKVDLVPLMDALEQQRVQLFAEARDSVLSSIDSLQLPQPLGTFLDELKPLVVGLADALFGDPTTAVPQAAADLRSRYSLSSLCAPLDLAFEQLTQLLDQIPHDDLVTTMETLRQNLGFGLHKLDPSALPARFRALLAAFSERSPEKLLGGTLSLPSLRAGFEARAEVAPADRQEAVVAVRARFDAVLQIVVPGLPASRIAPLTQAHAALMASLDQRAANLDIAGAATAYRQLYEGLDRLLPDFLRQSRPLSHADILAGIEALRPSVRAARLDTTLARFLDLVQPLADQIADLTNSFFGVLHEAVQLISPLTLRDSVAGIYDTIRDKIRIINPDRLAASIRSTILDPIMAPLQAMNPATIKARLQQLYEALLMALRDGARQLLDQITAALNDLLREVRTQIRALIGQVEATIKQALTEIEAVIKQLEGLIFVEILGRLGRLIDQLGVNFDKELDRVLNAFDQMLHAIPLGSSSASASVTVGV